jgi:hypothetical protein
LAAQPLISVLQHPPSSSRCRDDDDDDDAAALLLLQFSATSTELLHDPYSSCQKSCRQHSAGVAAAGAFAPAAPSHDHEHPCCSLLLPPPSSSSSTFLQMSEPSTWKEIEARNGKPLAFLTPWNREHRKLQSRHQGAKRQLLLLQGGRPYNSWSQLLLLLHKLLELLLLKHQRARRAAAGRNRYWA